MAISQFIGCALDDGQVECWGLGDAIFGQGFIDVCRQSPARVNLGSKDVVSVALGWDHGCALLSDGGVKCWGDNEQGQLGLDDTNARGDEPGEMGDSLPTVQLGEAAVAVFASGDRSCAILESGSVKCWGDGLGPSDLDVGTSEGDMAALEPIPLPEGAKVVEIAGGCFLLDSGVLLCGDPSTPFDLGTGRTATHIEGGEPLCAVLDGNRVKCWGNNDDCKAGLADGSDSVDAVGDALVELDLGEGFVPQSLASGDDHFCALSTDGVVKCWGKNARAQLGYESDSSTGVCAPAADGTPPPAWELGAKVVEIAAGDLATCARLEDGTVKCTDALNLGCID